jgi:hypothetical protein
MPEGTVNRAARRPRLPSGLVALILELLESSRSQESRASIESTDRLQLDVNRRRRLRLLLAAVIAVTTSCARFTTEVRHGSDYVRFLRGSVPVYFLPGTDSAHWVREPGEPPAAALDLFARGVLRGEDFARLLHSERQARISPGNTSTFGEDSGRWGTILVFLYWRDTTSPRTPRGTRTIEIGMAMPVAPPVQVFEVVLRNTTVEASATPSTFFQKCRLVSIRYTGEEL